jgi:N-acetyl-anhydromuramyl-L-alanine amidase AmpD
MQRKILGVRWWIWASFVAALGLAFWRRADIAETIGMIIRKPAHPTNKGSRNGAKIDTIVIHTTAGAFEPSVHWFELEHALYKTKEGKPMGASSAHYTIAKDGRVAQSVDEADAAYHANDRAVNNRSIGIELEGFPSDPKNYTPAMMQSLLNLTVQLVYKYGIPIQRASIPGFIGHEEIPAGKAAGKTDPGPYFPWDDYLANVRANTTGIA